VNIVRILRLADSQTLVLLDELGAGTDPTEGAALAMAIIEYLQDAGVKMIATTHYSELKAFAYNRPRLTNASVEFNVATLRPTYRLLTGIPGKSNAFEIARGLGLPEEIITHAGASLSQDQVQVADLITNLETDQRISERERIEAERIRREMEGLKRRLEDKETELANREGEIIRQAREESLKILKKTKEEADALLRELKAAPHQTTAKVMAEIREKEAALSAGLPEKRFAGRAPKTVLPGQQVEIPKLNQKGHVLTKPNQDGELYVQAGIMKILVKLKDLRMISEQDEAKGGTKVGHVAMEKIRSISNELDLRGKTVDEALDETAKYLDDCMIAGLSEMRIIHGKGTGALRDAVTNYLRTNKNIKSFRLGGYHEGGDGVTVVSLL
jgi:DNA mismatch repair protein MutS2